MKKWVKFMACLWMVVLGSVSVAAPTQYSGSLNGSASGGLVGSVGTNVWLTENTVFSWVVTDYHDGRYGYEYTLKVSTKQIGNFIIEVAPTFQDSNFLQYFYGSITVGEYGPNSSPGITVYIPEMMRGIKSGSGGFTYSIGFISDRPPMWGDVYAKSSLVPAVAIWNAGFSVNDVDPTAGPSNGSLDNHILVPGSAATLPVVPAPAAILLGGLGMGLIGIFQRRDSR